MNINPLTNEQREHVLDRICEGHLTPRNRQTITDTLSDGALRETYERLFRVPVPAESEISGQKSEIRKEAV